MDNKARGTAIMAVAIALTAFTMNLYSHNEVQRSRAIDIETMNRLSEELLAERKDRVEAQRQLLTISERHGNQIQALSWMILRHTPGDPNPHVTVDRGDQLIPPQNLPTRPKE